MLREFIAAFAAPAVALAAIGASAAVADGSAREGYAYGDIRSMLDAADARTHAHTIFERADLDGSGALDADEYASLAVVTAELARLNGFLAIERGGDEASIITLPIAAPSALSAAERVRVDAVARADFYAFAGDDSAMSQEEYLGEQEARFIDADRNGNGELSRRELAGFAARAAMISRADA